MYIGWSRLLRLLTWKYCHDWYPLTTWRSSKLVFNVLYIKRLIFNVTQNARAFAKSKYQPSLKRKTKWSCRASLFDSHVRKKMCYACIQLLPQTTFQPSNCSSQCLLYRSAPPTYIAIANRRGLFLMLSRINHSFTPNCTLRVQFKAGPTSFRGILFLFKYLEINFSIHNSDKKLKMLFCSF